MIVIFHNYFFIIYMVLMLSPYVCFALLLYAQVTTFPMFSRVELVHLSVYKVSYASGSYSISSATQFRGLLHFRCQAPQKTNTSVPSMFQGLLNIEGIWVQHKVSPPFNLLL